jgi:TRAP-type uncharacterized transport system substrate-binding protein
LVCAERNGVNLISWATERVLEKYGVRWEDVPAWGGEWIWNERPQIGLARVGRGEADGLFFEAIMNWNRLHKERPLRFFGIEPRYLEELHTDYALKPFTVEPGYFEGQEEPIRTIDFSDWLVCVREDLDEGVAYLIAKVLVERRKEFENRYTHRPLKESPLAYPILPEKVAETDPVPLHPGAERYYRERGVLN